MIKTITNIKPAGESSTPTNNTNTTSTNSNITTLKLWSKLRQSVVTTMPPPSDSAATPMDKVAGKTTTNQEEEEYVVSSSGVRTTTNSTTKPIHHYRIRSRNGNETTSSFWLSQTEMIANGISRYVTWTYRSSFYVTIITSYIAFMGIMILFAVGIFLSGIMQPHCIFVGGTKVFSGHFMDAVHLSWTTLATVGYGIIGPEIPDTNRRWYVQQLLISCFIFCYSQIAHVERTPFDHLCSIVVNMLMAFESFLGVLFGGFASAIIIGKMARFQSIAHIFFTDKICIKYGTAAALDADDDDDDDVTNVETMDEHIDISRPNADANDHPFPVLEFRMINLLSRERGGEILNAHVTVVASVLFNDCESTRHIESLTVRNTSSHPSNLVTMATETTTQAARMVGSVGTMAAASTVKLTGAALTCAKKLTNTGSGLTFHQLVQQVRRSQHEQLDNASGHDSEDVQRELDRMINETKQDIRAHIYVDEGNATLAPPRTYHKLQVCTINLYSEIAVLKADAILTLLIFTFYRWKQIVIHISSAYGTFVTYWMKALRYFPTMHVT